LTLRKAKEIFLLNPTIPFALREEKAALRILLGPPKFLITMKNLERYFIPLIANPRT
jgi:hypothetical protein